jgi:hypothetical protein
VFLYFGALGGEFDEVVVAFDVGGVVHEDDEEVGGDVDEFLC